MTNLTDDMDPDQSNNYREEFRELIKNLPDIIKSVLERFSSVDEQIMGLYATITVGGALMPHVMINYANKINYPALMTIFIFPPASGKGNLSLIRGLLSKINQHLMEENNIISREHQARLDEYKQDVKKRVAKSVPERPTMPLILAPGNITSAKLIEQLSDNGPGNMLVIYETEIDVFGISAKKGEHGTQNSTILRQAFHHETISQARKTNSELLVAECPKLCVILTGTINQAMNLFPSNSDGLLSRFLVVSGPGSSKWIDVKPIPNSRSLNEHFEKASEEFFIMWEFFKNLTVEVKFTDSQWKKINDFGIEKLAICNFTSEDAASLAKRHGNMITRIASILTMLNYYQNQLKADEILCNDSDFLTALWLGNRSFEASLKLFQELPGRRDSRSSSIRIKFFESLPDKFELKLIYALFPKMAQRTIQRWLKEFVDMGLIIRTKNGQYEKTEVAKLAMAHWMD